MRKVRKPCDLLMVTLALLFRPCNFPYFVAGRNQNAAAQWIHIFNHEIINEFRLGYMRSVDNTLRWLPRCRQCSNPERLCKWKTWRSAIRSALRRS
jgi:hypothetical protein